MDSPILANIELLVLDVDGVLTDGRIVLDDNGVESKRFCVHDGTGVKWIQRSGLSVCFLTGRQAPVVDRRAKELGVDRVYQGIHDKGLGIEQVAQETGVDLERIAYVGDDLIDLPAMRKVGFAVAVANARPEVKEAADFVTVASGGAGAVREFCEVLMKAQGTWESVTGRYFG